jgi:hypothetical protein
MVLNWLSSLWNNRKNLLICVLLIMSFGLAITVNRLCNIKIENDTFIEALEITVNEQTIEKEKLNSEIQDLQTQVSELELKNNTLKKELNDVKVKLKNAKTIYTNTTKIGVFKSYTDYNCLSKSSKQWQLQEKAYTDENGLRKIGDAYLVALGSYYGTEIGTEYTVTLSNGNTFDIMLCDCKKDEHTDSTNRYTLSNGCMIEFYVDNNVLPTEVKTLGTISAIPFFSGGVISIEKK